MTIQSFLEPIKKKRFRYAFSILLTVFLVYLLLSNIQVSGIKDVLKGTDVTLIIYGFFTYTLMIFFRVLRFRTILGPNAEIKELLPVVAMHNMYNNLLPARLGELSFFYLLKRKNRPVEDAMSTLFIARVSDFVIIYFFFFVSFLLFDRKSEISTHILNAVFLLFAIVIIVFIFLLIFHAGILKTFRRFIHIFGLDRFHRIDTIYEKLSLAVKNVREFKYINLFPVVFYTILIWTFSFFVFYILFVGMGLRLNFWNIALGASITIIINFFPIRGLGGFGTVEGAWTVGFMLAGLSASEAISSGFSIHILRIIFLLILGFTGYALRWRERVIKSKARSLSKYSDVMKEGCTNASDS